MDKRNNKSKEDVYIISIFVQLNMVGEYTRNDILLFKTIWYNLSQSLRS